MYKEFQLVLAYGVIIKYDEFHYRRPYIKLIKTRWYKKDTRILSTIKTMT